MHIANSILGVCRLQRIYMLDHAFSLKVMCSILQKPWSVYTHT